MSPAHTARIIPLRPRTPVARCCPICRVPFKPDAPSWWSLCRKCFTGAQLWRALERYRRYGS